MSIVNSSMYFKIIIVIVGIGYYKEYCIADRQNHSQVIPEPFLFLKLNRLGVVVLIHSHACLNNIWNNGVFCLNDSSVLILPSPSCP